MSEELRSLTRRTVLCASVAATLGAAGCTEDGGETTPADTTPTPTGSPSPTPDDNGGPTPDDGTPTPTPQPDLDIREVTESFVSTVWITHEHADGEVIEHLAYTEWDVDEDRIYRRHELTDGADGDTMITEYYVIGNATYQVFQDSCSRIDDRLIDQWVVAGLALPSTEDIEAADFGSFEGTTERDDRLLEVWEIDLSHFAIDGTMTIFVDASTGWLVEADGVYEIGHHDTPDTMAFTIENEFGVDLTIEPPEHC